MLDCFRLDKEDYPFASVLSVAHDNDRSLLYNGKYYSPLIDTIEDDLAKLGTRCVSVARIISTIKGDSAYASVVSPEGRFARALIQKRLLGLLIRDRYPYSTLEEKTWGSVLDKTGAKKVFGILPSRELCAASHKRGVWVADVQHGVIADTHPWYGKAFRGGDPAEQIPDAFLCWDVGSAEVLAKWAPEKGARTHVIGNRWLARFVANREDDVLVRELIADYKGHATAKDNRRNILVSLSWGEDNIPNGFMVEGLEAAIRETSHRYRWLIRLHPNQVRGFATHEGPKFVEYFNEALVGRAEWEQATRAPLPVVLRGIDLHISWQSSVTIEAAQMGIKTALLNPRLRAEALNGDYYSYYRSAGLVDLVPGSREAILSWIECNRGSKRTAETFERYDAEYLDVLGFLRS